MCSSDLEQLLSFQFFDAQRKKHLRSKSQNILAADLNFSMKEVQQLRLELANYKKVNEMLSKDILALNKRVKNSKDANHLEEIKTLKKSNDRLEEEAKLAGQQARDRKEELRRVSREKDNLAYKLAVKDTELENLQADLQKSKDLSSYLFKNTKVGLT